MFLQQNVQTAILQCSSPCVKMLSFSVTLLFLSCIRHIFGEHRESSSTEYSQDVPYTFSDSEQEIIRLNEQHQYLRVGLMSALETLRSEFNGKDIKILDVGFGSFNVFF